jgi:hypothetical protein
VRIYRTNARQFFHADDSDLVGLLCIAKALEGGESDLVSSHAVWNALQKENPDVVRGSRVQSLYVVDRGTSYQTSYICLALTLYPHIGQDTDRANMVFRPQGGEERGRGRLDPNECVLPRAG